MYYRTDINYINWISCTIYVMNVHIIIIYLYIYITVIDHGCSSFLLVGWSNFKSRGLSHLQRQHLDWAVESSE